MAKDLLRELRVRDARQRAVVVLGRAVGLELDGELAHVQGQFLNHAPAHLVVPNVLGRVELAEEDLGEFVGAVHLWGKWRGGGVVVST